MSLFAVLIVGFVVLGAIAALMSGSKSGFRILAVLGALMLAAVMASTMFLSGSSVQQRAGRSVSVNYSTGRDEDFHSGVTVSYATSTGDATVVQPGMTTKTTTTTADGEMLVLPLSDQVLVDLIGEEGVRAIEHLNESVPPQLRQAYAMIPISGPGSIGPTAIPATVRDQGFSFLKTAVSGLLSTGKTANAGEELLAEMEPDNYVAPDWTSDPGEGYIVVKSEFLEPSVAVEDALRPQIEAALSQHISSLMAERMGSRDGLENLADVSITDSAIKDCIVETSAHTMVLEDTIGQPTMRQTHGLIAFPDSLDDTLIKQVRGSLQQNRVFTLCATAGILWLSTFFLSIAFRAGQSQSVLRKLATLPMIGILIVPCVVMFVAMSGAMLRGETFDLSWSKDRVVCVIDKLSE